LPCQLDFEKFLQAHEIHGRAFSKEHRIRRWIRRNQTGKASETEIAISMDTKGMSDLIGDATTLASSEPKIIVRVSNDLALEKHMG